MPVLRPFRALRYDLSSTDLSAVLCPPYDIIGPGERLALLAQHPHNAVRLELPADVGRAGPEDYREAARTLASWRSDGTLRKDQEPTITLYRMSWRDPEGLEHSATGVFGRIRLEPFGPNAGILPHERTLSGPKEDRYQLLRATGVNTSPIVFVAGTGVRVGELMVQLTSHPPGMLADTPDGVRHELWVWPLPAVPGASSAATASDPAAGELLERIAAEPVTIADGHHRYETALRYREERGRNRACESDPAWDYVLALLYPLDEAPPALPTHRVLVDGPIGEMLLQALGDLFDIERLPHREALLARMASIPETPAGATGTGRIGLLSGARAALLSVDRVALDERLPAHLSEASRGLDVNALGVAIERIGGADAGTLSELGRLIYVKDAARASAMVEAGEAASCFLLDPMPVSAIATVAAAGEVMPQKSTYFHPKAPTGLLFGPLEW